MEEKKDSPISRLFLCRISYPAGAAEVWGFREEPFLKKGLRKGCSMQVLALLTVPRKGSVVVGVGGGIEWDLG